MDRTVTDSEVGAMRIKSDYARTCFEEALPRLRQLGRSDLVAAVEERMNDFVKSQRANAGPARCSLLRRATRKVKRFFPGEVA